MSFAENLQNLLNERSMKAVDLARAIDASEAIISDYLKGKKEPRGRQSIAIASALNVSLDELWETGYANLQKEKPATGEGDGLDEDIREIQSILDRLGPEERKEVLKFVKFQASEQNE